MREVVIVVQIANYTSVQETGVCWCFLWFCQNTVREGLVLCFLSVASSCLLGDCDVTSPSCSH